MPSLWMVVWKWCHPPIADLFCSGLFDWLISIIWLSWTFQASCRSCRINNKKNAAMASNNLSVEYIPPCVSNFKIWHNLLQHQWISGHLRFSQMISMVRIHLGWRIYQVSIPRIWTPCLGLTSMETKRKPVTWHQHHMTVLHLRWEIYNVWEIFLHCQKKKHDLHTERSTCWLTKKQLVFK